MKPPAQTTIARVRVELGLAPSAFRDVASVAGISGAISFAHRSDAGWERNQIEDEAS